MQDTVVEPGAELDCVVTDKNVRIRLSIDRCTATYV